MRISDWSSDVCSADLNPELFPNLSVGKLVNTVKQKYFSRAIGQFGQGAAISSHHVLSFDTVMLIGRGSRFASFADRHLQRCQSRLPPLPAPVKHIPGDPLQVRPGSRPPLATAPRRERTCP